MAHRPNHRRSETRSFIARRWEHRSEVKCGYMTPRRIKNVMPTEDVLNDQLDFYPSEREIAAAQVEAIIEDNARFPPVYEDYCPCCGRVW